MIATGAMVAFIEIRDPEADTSDIVRTLFTAINIILGALLGLLAGKSESIEKLGRRPDQTEDDLPGAMRATPFIATMAVAGAISAAMLVARLLSRRSLMSTRHRLRRPPPCLEVPGPPGEDGADGRDGVDGEDGIDAIDGADGQDGTNGRNGIDGRGRC